MQDWAERLPLSLRKVMPPVSPWIWIADRMMMMRHMGKAEKDSKEEAVRDGVAAKGIQGSQPRAAHDCSVI